MKNLQTFKDFLNEDAIKSRTDLTFIKKIINVIEKNGMKTTFDEKNGMITIKGDGDDDKVSLEYKY